MPLNLKKRIPDGSRPKLVFGKKKEASQEPLELEITYRDVRELKPDPRNTRTHPASQIKIIKEGMLAVGWTAPLILKKSTIVAGHGRTQSFQELVKEGKAHLVRGVKRKGDSWMVPCVQRDDMTEGQRRAYVIADNRTAELAGWDMDLLKDEMNKLMAVEHIDLTSTGFDIDFLDKYTVKDAPLQEDPEGGIIALKSLNEVHFPKEGLYDFPPLMKDKDKLIDLSKVKHIATWAGPGSEKEERDAKYWFYNYNSDSRVGLPLKKTILGFYVDDARFNCWYDDPPKYVRHWLENGIVGAVTPNYSTYEEWPKAERIFNIYRSRFVGRYMQEAGMKIIPDVEGVPDDLEFVCAGLKGFKTISIQAHQNYKTKELFSIQEKILSYIMAQLKPENILLYAPANRLRLFPVLTKANIIHVEPRTRVRQRRIKEEVADRG